MSEPRPLDALRQLAGTLLGVVRTRLELAGLELGEAQQRFAVALVVGVAAALLLVAALGFVSAWAALAAWDHLGASVLGWLALGYVLLAAVLLAWLRASARAAPPLLEQTLAELREDARRLRREDPPGAAPSATQPGAPP